VRTGLDEIFPGHPYRDRGGDRFTPSAHVAVVDTLPAIHGDPFDRILIAQAQTEPLRLLTGDEVISRYSELVVLV
jgi:PIN domain nuclease of toxin-antitoxin system